MTPADGQARTAMRPPAEAAVAVRDACEADISAVRDTYAHYVAHTLASFEEVPPDLEEMTARFRRIRDLGLPYLVAEHAGQHLGFAYASPFRPRSAYRFTVEDSIYVPPPCVGRGIGRRLLDTLIERCTELGYRQMIAVIGDSANAASVGLHRRAGFTRAGTLPSSGFKFGRWVDAVLMQRPLGEGASTLPG